MDRIVEFSLDGLRFGLALDSVERVLRAVAITPLPGAPEAVRGVIDLHGKIVAVVDLRRRLGLPSREYVPGAQLVIARSRTRLLALIVDAVVGVIEGCGAGRVDVESLAPGTRYLHAVVRVSDGVVLIHDVDAFLSMNDEQLLEQALAGGRNGSDEQSRGRT